MPSSSPRNASCPLTTSCTRTSTWTPWAAPPAAWTPPSTCPSRHKQQQQQQQQQQRPHKKLSNDSLKDGRPSRGVVLGSSGSRGISWKTQGHTTGKMRGSRLIQDSPQRRETASVLKALHL